MMVVDDDDDFDDDGDGDDAESPIGVHNQFFPEVEQGEGRVDSPFFRLVG